MVSRNVTIEMADIRRLMERNPLFAEALRAIALERLLDAAEEKLASLDSNKESVPIPAKQ